MVTAQRLYINIPTYVVISTSYITYINSVTIQSQAYVIEILLSVSPLKMKVCHDLVNWVDRI